MISVLIFVLFNFVSYFLSLARGPFWGLFAYMNIYFIPPNDQINWWASLLPFDRWSMLTSLVLILSLAIHKDKLSTHKLSAAKWGVVFLFLSSLIVITSPINKQSVYSFLYLLFTYCLIMYILIRSIKEESQLRLILFSIMLFVAYLSLDAYLNGKRINMRLEGSGSADANQSNEFALLLGATIPLAGLFLIHGVRWERLAALVSLPFMLNAFILCNSRGGAVAVAGGVIYTIIVVADKKMRRNMIGMLVLSAPLVLYLADDAYVERFSTLLGFDAAMEDQAQARNLSSGRTEIWEYGLAMVKDHPFGAGPQSFKELARFYMPEEVLTFTPSSPEGTRSAHNTYLQVMVEQGYIGLFIWMAMCCHTCILLIKSYKLTSRLGEGKEIWRSASLVLSISFIVTMLGGMLNSRVYYEYFWWQIAFAVILYALAQSFHTSNDSKEHVGEEGRIQ